LQNLDSHQGIITDDPAMKELLATVERVAASEIPVLLQGESGTGKELVARALHRLSPRAGEAFVAINCGAVPENLMESELFGHEKGAFTGALVRKPGLFEVADRGVLFLDEVGEISPLVQVKLLRAIETKEFFRVGGTRPVRTDVRLVSASNKNLKSEMQSGGFREDLYYRLNGVTLKLPALRERPADVPLLARHFVDRYAGRKKLTPRALESLARYSWPGNVRELQMLIQRAAVLAASDVIDADDLPLDVRDQSWKSAPVRTGLSLAEMEKEYIETVLRQHDGHRGKTARALGIDPKTLYNKLGPERPRKKAAAS
jgi:two-component system response regulator HydG